MATDNTQYKDKAEELIKLIKDRFLTPEGFLAREYPVSSRTLFDNFDDLVPFFLYFGEVDFLLSQVYRISEQKQDMVSLCAENGVVASRSVDEWFGGLYAIWQATNNAVVYRILEESMNFVSNKLISKNGFFSGAFDVQSNKRADFYDPWSAGLLECFCEMRQTFPDMFVFAQQTMRSWLGHKYFRRYGLFPNRVFSSKVLSFFQKNFLSFRSTIPSIPPRYFSINVKSNLTRPLILAKKIIKSFLFYTQNGWCSQLMKSNSTPAFTLLELYLATGDKFWLDNLLKWVYSTLENFSDNEGRVYLYFFPKIKEKKQASVTGTFILADIICDLVYFVDLDEKIKNDLLSRLKNILDHAWATRLDNGLVPMFESSAVAHTDNQIDFSVSLRKFGEITSDVVYKKRARELTERVFVVHYTPDGYVAFSGDTKSKKIDPKYNALMLKGLINLITMEEKIYPKFYSLFKDR